MPIGDDKELFEHAMNDDPAPETPEAAPVEAEPEAAATEGQPRDEHGKFVPKAKAEGEAATPQTPAVEARPVEQPKQKPVEQQDHRIPLSEHLSEREKRQAAERDRDELRRQADALTRQINELRQPKTEPPDPYADPQAFRDYGVKEALSPFEKRLEDQRLGFSKLLAEEKHGAETVSTALAAIERELQTNPQARFEYQRIMASGHPYGELVAWNKRQAALKEVGEDPAAYRQRVLEEARKDPEFVKSIIEAARGQAQEPVNGGQRSPNVKLPPSLNRTTGSGGQSPVTGPKTDGEMFKELFPQ
jgi:hypothetical protein